MRFFLGREMIPQKIIALTLLMMMVCIVSEIESARIIPRPFIRQRRSVSMDNDSLPKINFAVVLDAGSTSTRLRVYRYIQTADQAISPADISEMPIKGTNKVKPGISSYDENPEEAGEKLKPLIDSAKSTVPEQFQAKSNLFVLATAGIRSLQLDPQKASAADKILQQIGNYLSKKENNPFAFQNDFIRVISGQEESVFSWITVNWLKGNLKSDQSTVGTLDLGGSSAEVGYEYNTNDDNTFQLKLKKIEKFVYAVAHEHFGTEEARKMHMIKVIENTKRKVTTLSTPCYNKGYSEKFSYNNVEYTLKGVGNAGGCYWYSKKLFTSGKNSCNVPPCNMDTTNQPTLTGPLYLFSGFYYTLKRIGLLVSDCEQVVTFDDINQKLDGYCKKSAADLEKIGDEWAKYTCYMVSFAKALITEGYKINLENAELIVVGEIKGVKIGWALGAVLYNLNLL